MEVSPSERPPSTKPHLSRLAVASAIVGATSIPIVCCTMGIGGMVAVMLGMVALIRIRASGGTIIGRRYAWVGILCGVFSIALTGSLAAWAQSLQKDWDAQLVAGVRGTLDAEDEAASLEALRSWSATGGAVISADELERFSRSVRARYGTFTSISLVRQESDTSLLGDQLVTHVVNLEFDSGTRMGVIVCRLAPPPGGIMPALYLASMVVSGSEAEGGDLRFPPSAASDRSPADETAKDAGEEADAPSSPPSGAEPKPETERATEVGT